MKTTMTTTAVACALGLSATAIAAPLSSPTTSEAIASIQSQLASITVLGESEFYQGHFMNATMAVLNELDVTDMYTGMGGAMMGTIRYVT